MGLRHGLFSFIERKKRPACSIWLMVSFNRTRTRFIARALKRTKTRFRISDFSDVNESRFLLFGKTPSGVSIFVYNVLIYSGTLVASNHSEVLRVIPDQTYNLPETPLLSIGSAAQLLGVSMNLLRLYEAEGLILPARTSKNQRRYSREDLARISCIRHAIQNEHMTIASIKRMMALVPCWEIMQCSEHDRTNCEAFAGTKGPCWSFRHLENRCSAEECRSCKVYKLSSDCDSIKAAIITSTTRQ